MRDLAPACSCRASGFASWLALVCLLVLPLEFSGVGCSTKKPAKTVTRANTTVRSAGDLNTADAPAVSKSTASPNFERGTRANVKLLEGADLRLTRWVAGGRQQKIATDKATAIRVAADGKVSGKAPVNRYFGRFEFGFDGSVKWPLAALGATRMAGSPADMEAEAKFFQTLTATSKLLVSPKAVRFENGDGSIVLEFER